MRLMRVIALGLALVVGSCAVSYPPVAAQPPRVPMIVLELDAPDEGQLCVRHFPAVPVRYSCTTFYDFAAAGAAHLASESLAADVRPERGCAPVQEITHLRSRYNRRGNECFIGSNRTAMLPLSRRTGEPGSADQRDCAPDVSCTARAVISHRERHGAGCGSTCRSENRGRWRDDIGAEGR